MCVMENLLGLIYFKKSHGNKYVAFKLFFFSIRKVWLIDICEKNVIYFQWVIF